MEFERVLKEIREAKGKQSYKDLKSVAFWDDLYGSEITEMLAECGYHNYDLAKDTLQRLGMTVEGLKSRAFKLILQWPNSYLHPEDREWAIWDVLDELLSELMCKDSRIEKRWAAYPPVTASRH